MATGSGVNQGKSAFLEEFLPGNRDADLDAVNRAWSAAGKEGTISESLLSKLRSRLMLTGKRGANGGAAREDAGPAAKVKAKSSKGVKGNGASKADQPPSLRNGREGDTGPSRSAFVEEVLGREPESNLKAINDAWASAGHEGAISASIFYTVKRERGVTAGQTNGETVSPAPMIPGSSPKRGKAGPTASKSKPSPKASKPEKAAGTVEAASSPTNREPAPPKPTMTNRANGHGRELHEIEGEIDELMFRLKGLGGFAEVQEALRAARRLLVRSHEG